MESDQRLARRGLAFAGLLTLALAIVSAALLLSNKPLSTFSKIAALALVLAMGASVMAFAAAGLFVRDRSLDTSGEQLTGSAAFEAVRWRMNAGREGGIVAVVASILLAVGILFGAPSPPLSPKIGVEVELTDSGRAAVDAQCPGALDQFQAQVREDDLTSTNPSVRLFILAQDCGPHTGNRDLVVPRESISLMTVLAG
jgi:hypothetical protein